MDLALAQVRVKFNSFMCVLLDHIEVDTAQQCGGVLICLYHTHTHTCVCVFFILPGLDCELCEDG